MRQMTGSKKLECVLQEFHSELFTLLFPEKKSASDISAPEQHTQAINSDEIPEKTVA